MAQRSDIAEEVTRFRAHLAHWGVLSDSPEPCGRKLDFLLQEFNREANTLGSKSVDARTSNAAVELKVLIEQMRRDVGAAIEDRPADESQT